MPARRSPEGLVPQRWWRFVARLYARSVWHWRGLLLWLVQRPALRSFVLPLPGVTTEQEYHDRQKRRVGAVILSDLIYLRDRMGLATAFLENDVVMQAIRMFKHKKANYRDELRLKAARQAQAAGLAPSVGVGSRGGLPRTKGELMLLAQDMGLEFRGLTVQALRDSIKAARSAPSKAPTRRAPSPSRSSKATPRRTPPTPAEDPEVPVDEEMSDSEESAEFTESSTRLTREQVMMREFIQQEIAAAIGLAAKRRSRPSSSAQMSAGWEGVDLPPASES